MKTLIIYDSYFSNTEKIAQAIADGLGLPVSTAVKISAFQPEQLLGIELLIVGSPTRGFRPTSAIAGFIKQRSKDSLKGIRVAAFDTRLVLNTIKFGALRMMVKLGGYAAKPVAGQLEKKGGQLIVPPEGFFVTGEKGPLKAGECERAAQWAGKF
ncbi:hypothetical protein K8S19_03200 [bacterium]|nr:hypothetical protein [bacterium]